MVHKVLIVEDSATIRFAHKRLLEKMGFDVVVASDGREALETLRYVKPDLILMDIVMPYLNGYQLTRKIKGNPQLRHIPIILISSKSDLSDKVWAMKQGADAYLVKPINEEQLLQAMRVDSPKGSPLSAMAL